MDQLAVNVATKFAAGEPDGLDSFVRNLEDLGCKVLGTPSKDGRIDFRFPGIRAIATIQLKLFEF